MVDNRAMVGVLAEIVSGSKPVVRTMVVACSPSSPTRLDVDLEIDLREDIDHVVSSFDVLLSLHCQQIVPSEVLRSIRCVNLHPGFNPYNRGWFPHVFSIINGLPAGATLHEMDEQVDHGPIIAQVAVEVYSWDNSRSLYERVLEAERQLLRENFTMVVEGTYSSEPVRDEGNLNTRSSFDELRELDLSTAITMGQAIDRLRALSHDGHRNAFFIDPRSGGRIYVELVLRPD